MKFSDHHNTIGLNAIRTSSQTDPLLEGWGMPWPKHGWFVQGVKQTKYTWGHNLIVVWYDNVSRKF